MNPKLRAFLEINGLSRGAGESEAWAFYDQLRADGVDIPGIDPGSRPQIRSAGGDVPAGAEPSEPAPAEPPDETDPAVPPAEPAPAVPPAEPAPAGASNRADLAGQVRREIAAIRAAEVERIRGINEVIAAAGGVDDSLRAELLDDPQTTPDHAARRIIDHLRASNVPFGARAHAAVGVDSREKIRSATTDALCLRLGIPVENPADGAADLRGCTILEMARQALEANGTSTRGLSRLELATRALSSQSTSDFPLIFGDVVNRRLQTSYAEWPQTWEPFVSRTTAVDFRDIHAIRFSAAPDLKGIDKNGEYRHASFSEAGEKYRIITKGLMIRLSREMVVNDDLSALSRIPAAFGVAARRMEAAAVYGLITANPKMSDGKTLFHADHNNLDDTPEALGSDSLKRARKNMRLQRGLAKEVLDIQAAFLLAPVAMELDAEVLLRSTALPKENMSGGVYNPWANRFTPICDPHLDAASESAWYLLAHPSQVPTIEVAYLQGEENPFVDSTTDFDSDGLKIKVRHDFGAGLTDFVGIYKNAGA